MDKWFKAKSYGWGWQPASREGWLVTALFVAAIFFLAQYTIMEDESQTPAFLVGVFALTTLLIVICWRTGEKPQWRWGRKRF